MIKELAVTKMNSYYTRFFYFDTIKKLHLLKTSDMHDTIMYELQVIDILDAPDISCETKAIQIFLKCEEHNWMTDFREKTKYYLDYRPEGNYQNIRFSEVLPYYGLPYGRTRFHIARTDDTCWHFREIK